MIPKVVIVGANGHAKVIIDILKGNKNYHIVGCTDAIRTGEIMGIPILGDDSVLPDLYQQGTTLAFIALGSNKLRHKLSIYVESLGFGLINVISSYSYVSPSASIGKGTAVMPGSVINADCKIGNNVIVNTGATIDHDCIIENFVHIGPGSNLAGSIRVGEGAFLGIGTKVIPQRNIGQWAMIGAGSVIIHDLPDAVTAYGVPAKVIK